MRDTEVCVCKEKQQLKGEIKDNRKRGVARVTSGRWFPEEPIQSRDGGDPLWTADWNYPELL